MPTHLGDLDDGRKSGEAATYDDNFGNRFHLSLPAFHTLCCLSRLYCGGSRLIELLRPRPERSQASQSRARQDKEKHQTDGQNPFLRLLSGNDAPLRRKQPDAIREVPGSRDQAYDVQEEQWSLQNFRLHLAERSVGERVQVDSGQE